MIARPELRAETGRCSPLSLKFVRRGVVQTGVASARVRSPSIEPSVHTSASIGGMIDHIGIQCNDVQSSAAFYDRVLEPLGGKRLMEPHDGVIGYGVPPVPDFWLSPLSDSHTGWREDHIAFVAGSRAAVVAFFEAAVATGAKVLHEPKEWPEYHPGYFGAFVRDPDGNNVEAVCHIPE